MERLRSGSQAEPSGVYWEKVYQPTPIIAPIDGEVIVKSVNPGQTVTPSDDVVVLSDRLIVQAQVDETDIGRIKESQKAIITLDAYPEIEVPATVQHIYYESVVVNNVTIYKVDILPEKVPDVFRSGMSANAKITEQSKGHVLLVPQEAVKRGKGGSFVFVKGEAGQKPSKSQVELGISDENNVEVISGITENDTLIIQTQKYAPSKTPKPGTNPFMPSGGGGRR